MLLILKDLITDNLRVATIYIFGIGQTQSTANLMDYVLKWNTAN